MTISFRVTQELSEDVCHLSQCLRRDKLQHRQIIRIPPSRLDSESSHSSGRLWTEKEHERFLEAFEHYPRGPWKAIAAYVGNKTPRQVMSHAQKYRQKIARRKRGLQVRRRKNPEKTLSGTNTHHVGQTRMDETTTSRQFTDSTPRLRSVKQMDKQKWMPEINKHDIHRLEEEFHPPVHEEASHNARENKLTGDHFAKSHFVSMHGYDHQASFSTCDLELDASFTCDSDRTWNTMEDAMGDERLDEATQRSPRGPMNPMAGSVGSETSRQVMEEYRQMVTQRTRQLKLCQRLIQHNSTEQLPTKDNHNQERVEPNPNALSQTKTPPEHGLNLQFKNDDEARKSYWTSEDYHSFKTEESEWMPTIFAQVLSRLQQDNHHQARAPIPQLQCEQPPPQHPNPSFGNDFPGSYADPKKRHAGSEVTCNNARDIFEIFQVDQLVFHATESFPRYGRTMSDRLCDTHQIHFNEMH